MFQALVEKATDASVRELVFAVKGEGTLPHLTLLKPLARDVAGLAYAASASSSALTSSSSVDAGVGGPGAGHDKKDKERGGLDSSGAAGIGASAGGAGDGGPGGSGSGPQAHGLIEFPRVWANTTEGNATAAALAVPNMPVLSFAGEREGKAEREENGPLAFASSSRLVRQPLVVRNDGVVPATVRFDLVGLGPAAFDAPAALVPAAASASSSSSSPPGSSGAAVLAATSRASFWFSGLGRLVHVLPGQTAEFSAAFLPRVAGVHRAELRMSVLQNPYETSVFLLRGEGYVQNVTVVAGLELVKVNRAVLAAAAATATAAAPAASAAGTSSFVASERPGKKGALAGAAASPTSGTGAGSGEGDRESKDKDKDSAGSRSKTAQLAAQTAAGATRCRRPPCFRSFYSFVPFLFILLTCNTCSKLSSRTSHADCVRGIVIVRLRV